MDRDNYISEFSKNYQREYPDRYSIFSDFLKELLKDFDVTLTRTMAEMGVLPMIYNNEVSGVSYALLVTSVTRVVLSKKIKVPLGLIYEPISEVCTTLVSDRINREISHCLASQYFQ